MGDLITASIAYDLLSGNTEEGFGNAGGGSIISKIFGLMIMIGAGYLGWTCNSESNIILRIIFTLLAAFFGLTYLVYYFIRYKALGGKCGTKGHLDRLF